MKKILLLFLFYFFVHSSYSQKKVNNKVDDSRTNTYEVVYDFNTGHYENNNLQLKVNTPTVFKIININRLAYDIIIKSKDTLLAETFISDEFSDESLAAFSKNKDGIVISTLNGVITNPNKLDITSLDVTQDFIKKSGNDQTASNLFTDLKKIPSINRLEEEKLKYLKQLENIKTNKVFLNKVKSKLEDLSKNSEIKKNIKASLERELSNLVTTFTDVNEREKENIRLNDELSILTNELIVLEDEIKAIDIENPMLDITIISSDSAIAKVENDINSLENEISIKSNDLKEIVKKYNGDNLALQEAFYRLNSSYMKIVKLADNYLKIKTIADYPYLNKEKYKQEYKKEIRREIELILLERDVAINFNNFYNQLAIKYSNLKYNPYLAEHLNYGGQTKLFAQGDYIKELADKIHEQVVNIKIDILFQKIEHLKELLENDNTFYYVSAPIQPTQDAAIFDISIKKKEGNHSDVSDEKTFKHTEFTYGGTRIDFSIGLAASHFPKTAVYELGIERDAVTNEEYTILAKKDNKLLVPSMVGLVTMSFRRTQYMTYGGSAGLGIDVVNGKIQLSNFFIGPTVLLGKYDRLFISGGASLRNVGQLKSGYFEGQRLTAGSDDISNFITDKYKVGGFLALTYNLTRGVRANYKSIKSL